MMVLVNWDFIGSDEELKEGDKTFKKMADMSKGVEYLGRYIPSNIKWHFTYFFKCESPEAWATRKRPDWKRDRSKWTHGAVWEFV